MKILILNWKSPADPTAGGAERYVLEVATRWADDGHEITIFGPRGKASPTAVLNGRPNLHYVGAGSRLTVFRAADRYLRRSGGQFDWALESVSTRPFGAHRVVGQRAIALYHQTAEEVWAMEYPFPISWMGRTVLEPAWIRRMVGARVVANSPSTAAALGRYGITVEAIVPPGCDPPQIQYDRMAPGTAPRLLWMGRLVRTKRPEDAIAAFQQVREVLPDATLDLIGAGYLEAPIRAQHHPGVTVHGFVPEAVKTSLLSQADLMLLPGTREGWGIVAMEAASYGVPVVAYDIPGLRDAVLHGVTGVVLPANPEAMGLAAVSLLKDADQWRQLSQAAQKRAQEYTWDRVAQDLLNALTRSTRPETRTNLPDRTASSASRASTPSCTRLTSHPSRIFMRTANLAVALIAGISGQDGSYLAEFLLRKGYQVHGVVRRASSLNRSRIDHLGHVSPAVRGTLGLHLRCGHLTDVGSLQRLVRAIKPTEVYNLVAQSHVGVSFEQPEYTADVDGLGATRVLEALRTTVAPVRFYQARTPELFAVTLPPQNEESPFRPRSPYAAAKLYDHWMTLKFREAHDMFACDGILLNHQALRRGANFVTRKTTRGVAAYLKTGTRWRLGRLDARRGWGHACDDVDVDPAYVRPTEVTELLADPSKANRELGWYPRVGFEELIREMLESARRSAGLDSDQYITALPSTQTPDLLTEHQSCCNQQ